MYVAALISICEPADTVSVEHIYKPPNTIHITQLVNDYSQATAAGLTHMI